ncbi:uncharacterized protein L199_007528 [Kwoniella botswanensis]|uniref:uncharacterized protein n=1 Tax=Kwoniella botswanensis TaxID=1268659 RepID=UPI00315D0D75
MSFPTLRLFPSLPRSLTTKNLRFLPIRQFSSTPTYRNANPPSSKDPSHPYLHYHPNSTHLTLSFLPDPPVKRSKTILGYLPLGDATLDDFREEPGFLDTLHSAIQSGLELGKSDSIKYEAESRPTDGWIHVTDERAIPPVGRIGETEDLIGSVYVQDGKIIASTYSPLPTYRIITPNGVLTLPKGLDEHLIDVLRKIDKEEKGQ